MHFVFFKKEGLIAEKIKTRKHNFRKNIYIKIRKNVERKTVENIFRKCPEVFYESFLSPL